jgi:hypothetical protein
LLRYINELMVKKFSLLGAAALIMAQQWREEAKGSAMAGLLLVRAGQSMSDKKSLIMLLGRLLMSSLFLVKKEEERGTGEETPRVSKRQVW